METIPEVKIEGLEEALQQLGALSRAIDSVTESARLASSVLSGYSPTDATGLSQSEGSPFGGIEAFLGGPVPAIHDSIASALSAILVPELKALLQTVTDTAEGIRQATSGVDKSVAELKAAMDSLVATPLGTTPAMFAPFPHIKQEQGFFGLAGEVTKGAGYNYLGKNLAVGATAIGGGLLLESIEGDGLYDYDEDAVRHMQRMQSYGYGDIQDVEDGILETRAQVANRRARVFREEFEFFSTRILQLEQKANVELSPLLDDPGEFGRREQARALLPIYSKDLLDLIEQYKVAIGRDPRLAPSEETLLPWLRTRIDPEVLRIAESNGAVPSDQIAPATASAGNIGVVRFDPIQMEIKVLSDYRLSMKTTNPNPNINLTVDFYSGPRMRGP